ncbi:Uncharacterised protein [Mycobacterium tuberculosis]|nr:Uncharacterised protein [Mycobacterium tuberculosis]
MDGHRLKFAKGSDEPERGCGQAELIGGQPAQALPVGRAPDGTGVRHQLSALAVGLLDGIESIHRHRGGDRHQEIRLQPPDHRRQLFSIGHGDHHRLVGYPVGRRADIAVDGDHLRAQALQRDRQLPAGFGRTQQHHPPNVLGSCWALMPNGGFVLSFRPAVDHQLTLSLGRCSAQLFVYFRNSAHICLCTFAMRRWGQLSDLITQAIRT